MANLRFAPKVREDLGRVFASGKTRDVAWRKEQILGLVYMLKDNIDLFNAALAKDLGRAPLETHMYVFRPSTLKGVCSTIRAAWRSRLYWLIFVLYTMASPNGARRKACRST